MNLAPPLALGLLPALGFLVVLMSLDSFKLLRPGWILSVMAMGCAAAGLSYLVNLSLLRWTGLAVPTFARFVAPFVEELAKGLGILLLLRSHRIAFLVDAAISGVAIGTGFAMVENLYYLAVLDEMNPVVWVVRGFGTAIMHGGTTAIVALVARSLLDRQELEGRTGPASRAWLLAPGFVAAVAIHSLFNHFLVNPMLSTLGVLLALPPVVTLVFRHSEHSLRQWLDMGLDSDTRLLEDIHTGDFVGSRAGLYLQSLQAHFPAHVVGDMLCYLRLHLEMSMRAKGMLLMRESGFKPDPDPEIHAALDELAYLARRIGPTGKLAMAPFVRLSGKELWQLSLLAS